MIAGKLAQKRLVSEPCCDWLTVEPAGSWEEIYVVGHREMMIPEIEFRFVFHDSTCRLFEVIDFIVEKPAWRNSYCICVLPRSVSAFHGAPKFLNRVSIHAEFQPTRTRSQLDGATYVHFAHMPVGCHSVSDAQRWIFPLPLVHLAWRNRVKR